MAIRENEMLIEAIKEHGRQTERILRQLFDYELYLPLLSYEKRQRGQELVEEVRRLLIEDNLIIRELQRNDSDSDWYLEIYEALDELHAMTQTAYERELESGEIGPKLLKGFEADNDN